MMASPENFRMIKLKAKQPQSAPDKGRSLADQLRAAQAAAEEFIQKEVQRIKDSPEGASLPIAWLASNIRATTRAGGCHCKCALALLDRDGKK
jgi:hypothetical protein